MSQGRSTLLDQAWTREGFETVKGPGARALVRPEATPWVRMALEGGRTLHQAAAAHREAFRLDGREPLFVIPARVAVEGKASGHEEASGARASGEKRWAVRHYRRGGRLLPLVLGDRYLRAGRIRPLHEVEASETARRRGIPTPRIVAAAMYLSGPFYRADLVTVFVPGATDLATTLLGAARKGLGGAMERRDALRAAGELIRQMASRGLLHRDLHAGNILLEWRGAAPRPHLVDLDRCRVMPDGGMTSPDSMQRRLRRSLRKWERRTGLRISEAEWKILERAVAG